VAPEEEHGANEAPGWVYEAHTGLCLGPASYELAARYREEGRSKLRMNYCGYPQDVFILPSPRMAVAPKELLP